MARILIIDASAFIYRAFHVGGPVLNVDGKPVGAIQGFAYMMMKLLRPRTLQKEHDHVVAVFDSPKPNFRHKLYKGYKAGRTREDALLSQMADCRDVARSLGALVEIVDGFEADDVIASYAARCPFGMRATIASPDKDIMQVMHPGYIDVLDIAAKPAWRMRSLDDVAKLFGAGITPRQIADVQALCGDTVDKVPGIRGIGEVTASKLVARFGSLEGVLDAPESAIDTPRFAKLIKEGRDAAMLSYQLVKMRTDAPIKGHSAALRSNFDGRNIVALLHRHKLPAVMRHAMREYGINP